MAFRYINIGDGNGIFSPSRLLVVEDLQYSKTGKAFSVDLSDITTSYLMGKITLPTPIGSDLWIKCDLYIDSTSNAYYFALGNWIFNTDNLDCIEGLYLKNGNMYLNMNSNYNSTACYYTLKKKAVNKIWAHLHYGVGTNASYSEFECNGERFYQKVTRTAGAYAIGEDVEALKTITFVFPKNYPCYLSNVIISDTEILPKEQVIALPISETVTDMAAGDSGIYIADAANQSLLQSVDVSSLIENYGASSAITGIGLVGNPAYKTAEGLAKLTALSKSGGSIAEHNTIALSGDSTAMIIDCWGLSSVTIADLQNMQFGWKVGE